MSETPSTDPVLTVEVHDAAGVSREMQELAIRCITLVWMKRVAVSQKLKVVFLRRDISGNVPPLAESSFEFNEDPPLITFYCDRLARDGKDLFEMYLVLAAAHEAMHAVQWKLGSDPSVAASVLESGDLEAYNQVPSEEEASEEAVAVWAGYIPDWDLEVWVGGKKRPMPAVRVYEALWQRLNEGYRPYRATYRPLQLG